MDELKIIELRESIFEDNNADAELLRRELTEKGTFFINLMSAPGSGKTSTLRALIPLLKEKFTVAVMEADIDSSVDAEAIAETGVKCIQLHTGGMCHLDADMCRQGLRELDCDGLDLVILENVGNLVCPAEFDTGAHLNMTILSVPEGHDKPLKYPLMYESCSILAVNKTDVLPWFDFDMDKLRDYAAMRNPDIEIIPVSAKTGDGIAELAERIIGRVSGHSK
ncbi:MAG: hydrogenase nickel incorporation protein HypB [Oscillospiraceae bacterium]|nr:hydrogenase nickel incorporation protein HypB [Oscillospiraceae bacterium]